MNAVMMPAKHTDSQKKYVVPCSDTRPAESDEPPCVAGAAAVASEAVDLRRSVGGISMAAPSYVCPSPAPPGLTAEVEAMGPGRMVVEALQVR